MTNNQEMKCHAIIHTAATSAAAVATGLAQIPMSDNAVIVPIQTAMAISLGSVFGITLTQSAAEAAVATGVTTTIGRTISQWLVGWIPGWGNALNASTAFAITESLGWLLAEQFSVQAC